MAAWLRARLTTTGVTVRKSLRAAATLIAGAVCVGLLPGVASAAGGTVGGTGSQFHLADSLGGTAGHVYLYGDQGDEVYFGDWDGNGTDTPLIRRGNAFHVRNSNSSGPADSVFTYGDPGDTILSGDWDGNGTDTLAVRRGNTYLIKNSVTTGTADAVIAYGDPGDAVLVGDWNGDHTDTLAVRRGGTYLGRNSISTGTADWVVGYGDPGDYVIVGDWDGNGTDTLGVRRGGTYFVNDALTTGTATRVFGYGDPGDTVFVGDWDGNGTDTLGVRRPIDAGESTTCSDTGVACAANGVASPDPLAAGQGALLFQDDFTGAAGSLPDPSKWEDYSTATYNSTAAFGLIKPGDNETLDGLGDLVVPATPTAGSGIRTGAKFGFQYGTMSAWIKVPAQVGYWPAFWSLNSPTNGSDVFPIGEADAMESYTTWNNVYHGNGHTWTGNSATDSAEPDNYCPQPETADLSGRFNKFSATIEPGKVTFSFNDVPCATYTRTAGRAWGFGPDVTRPNWLILDLAIGGADGQQAPATQPAQMLVSRVEVRALPPA
jgi:hypothetical protein